METPISKRVKQIICWKLGVPLNKTNRKHSLRDDLGCDSLDAVELIMDLEKEYGIYIDDMELEKLGFQTWKLADVIRYITYLVNKKNKP